MVVDTRDTTWNSKKLPKHATDVFYHPHVQAILVKTQSGDGFVRVAGDGRSEISPAVPISIVATGPEFATEYHVLVLKPGQSCLVAGTPKIRLFRERTY